MGHEENGKFKTLCVISEHDLKLIHAITGSKMADSGSGEV